MAVDETAEKTARAAADELVRNVKAGGCVDEHLQDQVREFINVIYRKREREREGGRGEREEERECM